MVIRDRSNIKTKVTPKAGFTIVELLVIITVIGVLAGIGLAAYSSSQNRSKRVTYSEAAQQAKSKLAGYFTDFNRYPENASAALQYFVDSGSSTLKNTIADSGAFTYTATTKDGAACSDVSRNCQKYIITVSASAWSGAVPGDNIQVTP